MKIDNKVGDIHITLDTSRIDKNIQEAQKYLDNRVITDCEPFVPIRTGGLRGSARRFTELGSGRVVWNTPYAHYQYKGDAMVGVDSGSPWAKKNEPKEYNGKKLTYSDPATGPNWFERAKKRFKKSWIEGVERIVRKK